MKFAIDIISAIKERISAIESTLDILEPRSRIIQESVLEELKILLEWIEEN